MVEVTHAPTKEYHAWCNIKCPRGGMYEGFVSTCGLTLLTWPAGQIVLVHPEALPELHVNCDVCIFSRMK